MTLKQIEKRIAIALEECWKNHRDILKDHGVKKYELEHYLNNQILEDWEDVAFYTGFISALKMVYHLK